MMKRKPAEALKLNKSSKKEFKPQNKSNDSSKKPETAILRLDDDPDFPRGGGIGAGRKELNDVSDGVHEYGEEELNKSGKKKKNTRKSKSKQAAEEDLGSLFGEGITRKLPRFANKITLKMDEEKQRISLSMRNLGITYTDDNQTPDVDQRIMSPENGGDSDNEEFPVLARVEARASVPALEVTPDDISLSDEENIVTHDEGHINDAATKIKNERRTKKKAKAEREEEIMMAEERQLVKDIPRTADEFEKLLRTSPDSSLVWIKYMEFMVSLSDIEKARAIAERALRTINMQFEEEKLNVWVAYLNLENKYGNPPEEAVQGIFKRALAFCDPEKIHLRLLEMYERTEQHKLAGELLDKMTKNKKFRQSEQIWLRLVEWILKVKGDGFQSAQNRAVLSLPKNKHIPFLIQAAILQFKYGVPDTGRSMFENILKDYPKRKDLWTTYIDQANLVEIRLGDADVVRALFERATSLSLPAKKMMSLFTKFLEYEKSHGDEDRVEYVKTKAREYQESTEV